MRHTKKNYLTSKAASTLINDIVFCKIDKNIQFELMERYNEKLGNGTKVFILSYTVILFNTITPLSLRLDGNGGQMLGGKLAKMFDIQPGIWTKGVTYKSASRKITLAELLSILLTEANQLRHKFSLLVS